MVIKIWDKIRLGQKITHAEINCLNGTGATRYTIKLLKDEINANEGLLDSEFFEYALRRNGCFDSSDSAAAGRPPSLNNHARTPPSNFQKYRIFYRAGVAIAVIAVAFGFGVYFVKKKEEEDGSEEAESKINAHRLN